MSSLRCVSGSMILNDNLSMTWLLCSVDRDRCSSYYYNVEVAECFLYGLPSFVSPLRCYISNRCVCALITFLLPTNSSFIWFVCGCVISFFFLSFFFRFNFALWYLLSLYYGVSFLNWRLRCRVHSSYPWRGLILLDFWNLLSFALLCSGSGRWLTCMNEVEPRAEKINKPPLQVV